MSAWVRSKLFGFRRRLDASYLGEGYAMRVHADVDVRAPSNKSVLNLWNLCFFFFATL
jgi:hypothetical protein